MFREMSHCFGRRDYAGKHRTKRRRPRHVPAGVDAGPGGHAAGNLLPLRSPGGDGFGGGDVHPSASGRLGVLRGARAVRLPGRGARRRGPSPSPEDAARAERNHALADKLAEAAIFLGIGLGQYAAWWLVITVWLTSVAATGVGFVMLHAAGIPRGLALFDRTDRMLALLAFLLLAFLSAAPPLALLCVMIAMDLATVIQRLIASPVRNAGVPRVADGRLGLPENRNARRLSRDLAVAGIVSCFRAMVAVPLSLVLALVFMMFTSRGEASADGRRVRGPWAAWRQWSWPFMASHWRGSRGETRPQTNRRNGPPSQWSSTSRPRCCCFWVGFSGCGVR